MIRRIDTRRLVLALAAPVIAGVAAIVISSIVLLVSGSSPVEVYGDMLENASRLETTVDMLNRATPLYISGVAAAIGFRMNLFNIGVEGQYLLAAFFAAAAGAAVDLPAPLHIAFILIVAMSVGSAYAGFAGVLKVTRGVNEVISTIILNSIAVAGIIAWLLGEWQDDSRQGLNQGTAFISGSGRLPDLNSWMEIFTRDIGKGRHLTSVILIAILVGIAFHVFVNRMIVGFDLRASGSNPTAAGVSGVNPKRMVVLAMALSGACAGLVGMSEILVNKFSYDRSMVSGLGFKGIAVALLGRNHPVGIAFGALLWAFLDASSGILQSTNSASREIVEIMQGVILLTAVAGFEVVKRIRANDEARGAAEAMAKSADRSIEGAMA
ncbi:MAG: ABC transporter permease [Acidimicrobiales bacterium]